MQLWDMPLTTLGKVRSLVIAHGRLLVWGDQAVVALVP
jgi:hypothetical protein